MKLKHFAEWYLGLEPSRPGEGTQWRFQTSGPSAALPSWSVIAAGVLVMVLIAAFYSRDGRSTSRTRRWTLTAMRISSLTLLLLLLLQVSVTIDRTGLPVVVVMIDDSASMQFQDEYPEGSSPAEVAGVSSASGRIDVVRAVLTNEAQNFLRRLREKYRIRFFRFSDRPRPLSAAESDDAGTTAGAIENLRADGQSSAIASSVRQVLDEFRGNRPAAVVIFTDGIASGSQAERLHVVAESAREAAVPFYVVGVGSTRPAQDAELVDVRVDEIAIVNQLVLFSANLRTRGFNGRDAVLELRDVATDERVAAKTVRIEQDDMPVEISYTPVTAGEFDYQMQVVPLDGEAVTDNNAETRHLSVREDRIRVLLIDRLPRYEYRFLKHLLERSDGKVGTIALDTILTDADAGWAASDRSAATLGGRVPGSRADLFTYDVVILGDIPPSTLSPGTQQDLRDFVRDKGAGLILVAGPAHNPHGFRNTPLESLIPLDLSQGPTALRKLGSDGIRAQPTVAGRRGTNLFRFGESPAEVTRAIDALPDLFTVLEIPQVGPGANVLAVDEQSGRAVLIAQQYGAGRVVLHATDDLWMWQQGAGDQYYAHYWTTLIRSLSRSALLGRDTTAELLSDRDVYRSGENVLLTLRFFDTRRQPQNDGVVVQVQRQSGTSQVITMKRSAELPGVWTALMTAPTVGRYHLRVAQPIFEQAPPTTDFEVRTSPEELRVRRMDERSLQAAARATRGRYYNPAQARRIPDELPAGRTTARRHGEPILLWNRPEILLLMVVLLGAEWFLRKKANLT